MSTLACFKKLNSAEQSSSSDTSSFPVNKFPLFYGTRIFVTIFMTAGQWSKLLATRIQFKPTLSCFFKIYFIMALQSITNFPRGVPFLDSLKLQHRHYLYEGKGHFSRKSCHKPMCVCERQQYSNAITQVNKFSIKLSATLTVYASTG
jgi:hypothetical protein